MGRDSPGWEHPGRTWSSRVRVQFGVSVNAVETWRSAVPVSWDDGPAGTHESPDPGPNLGCIARSGPKWLPLLDGMRTLIEDPESRVRMRLMGDIDVLKASLA